MIQRRSCRWTALLTVLALAGCQSASKTGPTAAQSAATPTSATAVPEIKPTAALFYAKGGSVYVSAPAGAPGRQLTAGSVDTQPAPSPDQSHVAFVRKRAASDYGGELWVLDLSPQLAPLGTPRRLVDPATLPHGTGEIPPMVASPRWSPTGQQLAFVDNPTGGAVDGGVLLVAGAETGAVEPRPQPPVAAWAPFAESAFAWAPDGSHIVWLNERSDVRPVDVNVLAAVGGASAPVATGTNASSVTYGDGGRTIIFTNGDTTDPVMFPKNPFAVRTGGIYSVPASAESGATPATPTPLFTGSGLYYGDVTVLGSGAVAFTTQAMTRGIASSPKTIQILDKGSSLPRATVTEVAAVLICQKSPRGDGSCRATQGPVWGAGDIVAYLDTSPQSALVVTDLDNRSPRRVDTDVDSFAWSPRRP